jgi:hypothetical protein
MVHSHAELIATDGCTSQLTDAEVMTFGPWVIARTLRRFLGYRTVVDISITIPRDRILSCRLTSTSGYRLPFEVGKTDLSL